MLRREKSVTFIQSLTFPTDKEPLPGFSTRVKPSRVLAVDHWEIQRYIKVDHSFDL